MISRRQRGKEINSWVGSYNISMKIAAKVERAIFKSLPYISILANERANNKNKVKAMLVTLFANYLVEHYTKTE